MIVEIICFLVALGFLAARILRHDFGLSGADHKAQQIITWAGIALLLVWSARLAYLIL